jgi:hypothetical protein
MKNQPYAKQFNEIGVIVNPITKENPFNNAIKTNRHDRRTEGKYIILTHPSTGEFLGKIKSRGNNRKSCKRTGKPRNFHN